MKYEKFIRHLRVFSAATLLFLTACGNKTSASPTPPLLPTPTLLPTSESLATISPPESPSDFTLDQALTEFLGDQIEVKYQGFDPEEKSKLNSTSFAPLQFLQKVQDDASVSIWQKGIQSVVFNLTPDETRYEINKDGKTYIINLSKTFYDNPTILVSQLASLLEPVTINGKPDNYLNDALLTLLTVDYEELYGQTMQPSQRELVDKRLGVILIRGQNYQLLTSGGYAEWTHKYPEAEFLPSLLKALNIEAAKVFENQAKLDNVQSSASAEMLRWIADPQSESPLIKAALDELQRRNI